MLSKYQLIKKYRSKLMKNLKENFKPILVPRRAPRYGGTVI